MLSRQEVPFEYFIISCFDNILDTVSCFSSIILVPERYKPKIIDSEVPDYKTRPNEQNNDEVTFPSSKRIFYFEYLPEDFRKGPRGQRQPRLWPADNVIWHKGHQMPGGANMAQKTY